jgi:hypothetical protein
MTIPEDVIIFLGIFRLEGGFLGIPFPAVIKFRMFEPLYKDNFTIIGALFILTNVTLTVLVFNVTLK